MADQKPGSRATLTLSGKGGKRTPAAPGKPQKAPTPNPPPRPKGPAYTPPKAHEPFMERFWLVMRSNGQRPKVRQPTLEAAQEEARRIAANRPGVDMWVIECRTVETVCAAVSASTAAPAIEGGMP
jgi:hypothetical protein